MKRTISEVIRRGFDNTVANWPLILLRVAETAAGMALLAIAAVAAIVPIALSTGLDAADFKMTDAEDPGAMAFELLGKFWFILVVIFGVLLLVALLWLLLHAFVTAGVTRVYVDGDRAAGDGTAARERYRVFTMERFLAGARNGWATVFWIYNAVWGFAGLILLIPLIFALALILVLRESTAAIVVSCLTLALALLLAIVISIIANIWTQKAIVIAAERNAGTKEALAVTRHEFRVDLGRHAAVCLLMITISFGVSGAVGSASSVFEFPFSSSSGSFHMAMLPLYMGTMFLNFAASTAVGSWFLATLAAMSERRP